MSKRYAIWDKTSPILTSIGEVLPCLLEIIQGRRLFMGVRIGEYR